MNANHDPFIHKRPLEFASHIFVLTLPTHDLKSGRDACRRHWQAAYTTLSLGAVCRILLSGSASILLSPHPLCLIQRMLGTSFSLDSPPTGWADLDKFHWIFAVMLNTILGEWTTQASTPQLASGLRMLAERLPSRSFSLHGAMAWFLPTTKQSPWTSYTEERILLWHIVQDKTDA